MLCRTASDLYWMARQVERAENTARLVDYTQRISLLPERVNPLKTQVNAWHRTLDALGLASDFQALYGDIEPDLVVNYLTLDSRNPTSIRSALYVAREFARAQRVAITAEMYQELNTSWLDLENQVGSGTDAEDGLGPFLDWVKRCSAAFRGVTDGTMGRDEGYRFMALGTHVERADNTVRLLDVKYAPYADTKVNEENDFVQYYQWSALMQALSLFETYRKFYQDAVRPVRVAEMMIFDRRLPRSLVTCTGILLRCLRHLVDHSGTEVERQAGALDARLRYGRMNEVLDTGMEAFLDGFMTDLDALTEAIVTQFMVSTETGNSGTRLAASDGVQG